MRTHLAILAAAVLLAGCGKSHDWKTVSDDDPRLEAARQQARDSYPDFVKAVQRPRPMTLYVADVLYEADGQTELLSLEVQKATEEEITGKIIGYPQKVKLYQHDVVTVPVSALLDWKITTPEGESEGGFVEAERIKLQRGG